MFLLLLRALLCFSASSLLFLPVFSPPSATAHGDEVASKQELSPPAIATVTHGAGNAPSILAAAGSWSDVSRCKSCWVHREEREEDGGGRGGAAPGRQGRGAEGEVNQRPQRKKMMKEHSKGRGRGGQT